MWKLLVVLRRWRSQAGEPFRKGQNQRKALQENPRKPTQRCIHVLLVSFASLMFVQIYGKPSLTLWTIFVTELVVFFWWWVILCLLATIERETWHSNIFSLIQTMKGFILKRLDVSANSKLSTELSLPTLKPHQMHSGKHRAHGSHINTANMFSTCIFIWIYIHATEISPFTKKIQVH